MATKTIQINTKVYIPIATGCCQEVALCVTDAFSEFVSNTPPNWVFGTIENAGRQLSPGEIARAQNPRCLDLYQYSVSYDDTQLTDPTDSPLTCDDVVEVNPYVCTVRSLIAIINAL